MCFVYWGGRGESTISKQNCVLIQGLAEDLNLGIILSDFSETFLSEEIRKVPGYIGLLPTEKKIGTSEADSNLGEIRHYKLMNLVFFYVCEDASDWVH